jgi:multidrug transporter EmrE-like cation transporter
MNKYALLTAALVCNAAANVLIKAGMRTAGALAADAPLVQKYACNPFLWAGLASFGIALGFYSLVLAKMPLSIAYPIMTTVGFAIVLAASAVFFGERLTPVQYAGIALIAVGVWLAARA